ncbi:hypothetical protein BDN70DRAFT_905729 [Pholiota conissans]|uniref:HIT-type domain-containing protein n=1 Tax=Pholiota conissans TaxID=109636 RepID=A0A9P6CUG8_9AGAR|nr:hypothetical protein BDN70DRAFT_905729 [Pholiota conissans]
MASDLSIQISTKAEGASTDRVTCRLCRRQFAKYTCPKCNVPYCSLTCFRSQAHTQCSEGFYKKEIESDIHSGPSKTAQERQKMMELLKNFEEEASNENTFLGEDEEEDDSSDLAKRFESVNLDSASPDTLWAMLTPAERSKFMKAFDDPTSEFAQQLLASEQLDNEIEEPWWEAPRTIVEAGVEDEAGRQSIDLRTGHRYGSRPTFMSIPESMVKAVPVGHPLVYNMCAICISYAYITRHLGTSPLSKLKPENADYHDSRRLLTQMVPFLTDRKSTKVYPSISAVITDIWSTFELGTMTGDLFALLLRDSACLLKPLRITQIVPTPDTMPTSDAVHSAHPHTMPVLVLSDLNGVFSATLEQSASQGSSERQKGNHITHKLLFYAAHILSTPTGILDAVANEMRARAQGYGGPEEMGSWDGTRVGEGRGTQPVVEEIL